MSEEQEEQAQGAILLKLTKTKKRLAVLQEEARSWSRELSDLCISLATHPEFVSVDGQGMNVAYGTQRKDFKAPMLDSKRLATLTDELRKTLDEKNHLEEKLKQLGLDL